MEQYNYKLVIAYDGTNYSGWQIQPNAISIQELIQNALKIFLRREVTVIGSGRTDAGVHAMGQVAHFKCDLKVDLFPLLRSLNGILPRDIRVLEVAQVPLDFHSQRSAISKTYHYHLYLDKVQDPFRRLYSFHVHSPCNVDLLKQASALFVGTHDFTSFANEAHEGCAANDPVRTIEKLEIIQEPGGIRLEFTADGFLYKMVRNIVGMLLEVASGKRLITEIPHVFEAKDRKKAGPAASPQGLFLMYVDYPIFSKEL